MKTFLVVKDDDEQEIFEVEVLRAETEDALAELIHPGCTAERVEDVKTLGTDVKFPTLLSGVIDGFDGLVNVYELVVDASEERTQLHQIRDCYR